MKRIIKALLAGCVFVSGQAHAVVYVFDISGTALGTTNTRIDSAALPFFTQEITPFTKIFSFSTAIDQAVPSNSFNFTYNVSPTELFGGSFQRNADNTYSSLSLFYNQSFPACVDTRYRGVCNNSALTSNFVVAEAGTGVQAVPEPATWAMLLTGFGAIGFAMRRKRHQVAAISYS